MSQEIETVSINVCDACPCKCIGCYSYNTNSYMSLDDFKLIIKKLPKSVTNFIILGGEPFLNKELYDMLSYLKDKRKVKPNILTSGTVHINFQKFKPLINILYVTIKYPNLIDSEWKRNPTAFRLAKEFIQKARKEGVRVVLNWCVDKENMKYYDDMIDFSDEVGAEGIDILRFMPYNKEQELFLPKPEWEQFCAMAVQNKKVRIASPSKQSYQICPGGMAVCNILTNGSVTPCMYDAKNILGNIKVDGWNILAQKLREWRESRAGVRGCLVLYDLL